MWKIVQIYEPKFLLFFMRIAVLIVNCIKSSKFYFVYFVYYPSNIFCNMYSFENWEISELIIHQIFSLACNWPKHVMWPNIPQLKLRNIQEYSPIFKTARVAKKIWRIINTIASIWHENMLRYLSLDIICSLKLTCFLELCSQKTIHDSEQIMSVDKYPRMFLCQMEAIVYIFSHVTHLDQSHMNKNIWWIIMTNSLYEKCPHGIMVVVFIKTNVQSMMINTTTMIPCRHLSYRKLTTEKNNIY